MPCRLMDGVAIMAFLAGFIGMSVHMYYARHPGPNNVVRPNWINVWLTLFVAFFAIQLPSLYRLRRHHYGSHRRWRIHFYSTVLSALISFVTMIGCFVAYRVDMAIWCIVAIGVLSLSAWYISLHQPERDHYLYKDLGIESGLASSLLPNDNPSAAGYAPQPPDVMVTPNGRRAISNESGGRPSSLSSPSASMRDRRRTQSDANPSVPWWPSCMVHRPCAQSCWFLMVTVFRCIIFAFTLLVMIGIWTIAAGSVWFPQRGQSITVTHYDGQQQQIHYWCRGPTNSTYPTIWLDIGGGGHCMADGWGLQEAILAKDDRRVCMYDPPGTCHSGCALGHQPYVLDRLIEAINEPGPFIMIATMDNAPQSIYNYAIHHPEQVLALVVISYSGTGTEYKAWRAVNGLTDPATIAYAQDTAAQRIALSEIIQAIALSWGFMEYMIPPNDYYAPAERRKEQVFLNLVNEMQWRTQANVLTEWKDDPSMYFLGDDIWEANRSLTHRTDLPVIVFQQWTDIIPQCEKATYTIDSIECRALNMSNILADQFARNVMATATASPLNEVFSCTNASMCWDHGFLIDAPALPWLLNHLWDKIGNITLPIHHNTTATADESFI